MPSMSTVPRFGFSSPVMTLNKVVFPAPFGPISPETAPGSATSDTGRGPARHRRRPRSPVPQAWTAVGSAPEPASAASTPFLTAAAA